MQSSAQVIPFSFDAHPVRTLLINDQPWFVATDICAALAIANTTRAMSRLDDDEKGLHSMNTPGGTQNLSILNESGLYSLILTSRKAEAKRFKKWVTAEVLPAIRKHGHYSDDDGKLETLVGQTIGTDGFHMLGALIKGKVAALPAASRRSATAKLWSQTHSAFGVRSAADIPADQLDSARNFIAAYAIEGEYIEVERSKQGLTLSDQDIMALNVLLGHFGRAAENLTDLYTASRVLQSRPLLRVWDHLHEGKPSYRVLMSSLGAELKAAYLSQIGEVGRRHLHS